MSDIFTVAGEEFLADRVDIVLPNGLLEVGYHIGTLLGLIGQHAADREEQAWLSRLAAAISIPNCIGAFDVPGRRKIPEANIIMKTRKGVALSYAPEEIAV